MCNKVSLSYYLGWIQEQTYKIVRSDPIPIYVEKRPKCWEKNVQVRMGMTSLKEPRPLRQQLPPPLSTRESERSSMWPSSGESSATSSRSEEVVQLIIVGWLVQNFRQEILPSHYRNDPVKYDLGYAGSGSLTYEHWYYSVFEHYLETDFDQSHSQYFYEYQKSY